MTLQYTVIVPQINSAKKLLMGSKDGLQFESQSNSCGSLHFFPITSASFLFQKRQTLERVFSIKSRRKSNRKPKKRNWKASSDRNQDREQSTDDLGAIVTKS
eukprot:scaffold6695_cov59-Cylindrotheca_fusiformis.AAC.1